MDQELERQINKIIANPFRDINRNECAKAIGVSRSTLSRILSPDPDQRRMPSLRVFRRLSHYLGIPMDELYNLLYDT